MGITLLGAENPIRTQANDPGLTLRCAAPSEYLVPTGVSITPGTAGGRGSVGPLAKLTGCRHWGALGPAILHLHREHMASASTGAGRKSLQGFGPCRKPFMRPSWVRTGLPRPLASTAVSPLR